MICNDDEFSVVLWPELAEISWSGISEVLYESISEKIDDIDEDWNEL